MSLLKKRDKEKQKFSPHIKYIETREITSCFEHFKERLDNRVSEDLCPGYHHYWDTWVVYLRGKFVVENDGMMYRMIGSYFNDEKMYKLVYKKINTYNIYVPLTIFELTNHKRRYRYYMKSINKNYHIKNKEWERK